MQACYVYDIEVFKNTFTAVFINVDDFNTPLLKKYEECDIRGDRQGKKDILRKLKHRVFVAYKDRNDIPAMIHFIKSNDLILAGYNSLHYDDVIIKFILKNEYSMSNCEVAVNLIYNLSVDVINYDGYNYYKDRNIRKTYEFVSIDLMSLNYLDKSKYNKISLKQVSIQLKHYKVEDYTMPECTIDEFEEYYSKNYTIEMVNNMKSFDRWVCDNHIDAVIDYNINDVIITYKLYKYSIKELKLRYDTQAEYGIRCLSLSRSSLGSKLMSKFYSDATGLEYWDYYYKRTKRDVVHLKNIIMKNIKFESKELSELLLNIKSTVVDTTIDEISNKMKGWIIQPDGSSNKKTFSLSVHYGNTDYTIGLGGLHSVDLGAIYKSDDSYLYKDEDVDSYYPISIINNGIYPEHLSKKGFRLALEVPTYDRIKAKKAKHKSKADILKIAINKVFGGMGSPKEWFYDPAAMLKTTINNQLFLLMLIEQIEKYYRVVSANTDGVVTKIPNNETDINRHKTICEQWEKDTGFHLSPTSYELYVRTGVNSYLSLVESDLDIKSMSIDELKSNGVLKQKNEFITDIVLDKGYLYPVVALALNNYYIKGIPYKDTIKNHINNKDLGYEPIYDYCISQKIGADYIPEYHYINNGELCIKRLQKNNRYYVSNSGGSILKRNKESGKLITMLKNHNVIVFNDFFYSNNYDINYNFYYSRCQKIIDAVNRNLTDSIKKHGGTLFD